MVKTFEPYNPPEWMNDTLLDLLGGRELVIELMSGPRATTDTNAYLALAQLAYEVQIDLLEQLHDKGMLVE